MISIFVLTYLWIYIHYIVFFNCKAASSVIRFLSSAFRSAPLLVLPVSKTRKCVRLCLLLLRCYLHCANWIRIYYCLRNFVRLIHLLFQTFSLVCLQGLIEHINISVNKKKDEDSSIAELTRKDVIKCIQSDKIRFRGVNLSSLDLSKLVRSRRLLL